MMKRTLTVLLACVLAASCLFAGCGNAASSSEEASAPVATSDSAAAPATSTDTASGDQLKVAMVCSGAINDGSWNTSGYDGLMAIGEELGAETAYSEQVSTDELPTVLRSYGREGYDIIIAHSMEYDEQMKRIAPEFPDTKFITINGFSTGDNLYAIQFKYWELQYFMGMAGALASENNSIAVIAAMETEMVKMEQQAMKQGAAYVNPDCQVSISFTGDWNDLAKAKEASLAQIDSGADVLLANVSSAASAIFGACTEKDVYGMGWGDDVFSMAPDNVVVCALFNMKDLYRIGAQIVLDGTDERDLLLTMADGAMSVTPLAEWLPQDKRDAFDKRVEEYMNGEFTIDVEGSLA